MPDIAGPLSQDQFQQQRTLLGERTMPQRLVIGTAALGGVWGSVDHDMSVRVLLQAWDDGFTWTDTAPNYASAEEVISRALQQWRGERPVVFTKLEGNPRFAPPNYARDWPASFEKQLSQSERLMGEAVLYGLAMHDPEGAPPEYAPACDDFIAAQLQRGRIAVAGIGGGGAAMQARFLPEGRYRYVITYLRLAAVTLQAMSDIVPLCRRLGVALFAASPMFTGLLGAQYDRWRTDPPRHVHSVFIRRAEAVHALAQQAGISLSQLALRFMLSLPAVAAVVVGPATMQEWRDIRSACEAGPLDAELFSSVSGIARGGDEPTVGG